MAVINYFVVAASVCLIMALIEAWLLVAVFSAENGPVAKIIPGRQDLLRSHIDYLMMAQFLFVFFAVFKILDVSPPLWIVAAACVGSFFNPFAFLVRAMKPSYLKNGPAPYMAMIMISCILTTIGYGTCAWMLASAALR